MTWFSPFHLSLRNPFCLVLASVSLWLALVVPVLAEEVVSFNAVIVVDDTGLLTVTETIDYDFGTLQKHGIYREISEHHAQPASTWYKERFVDFQPVSVTRDGVAEPYTEESYPGLKLRIGDPHHTISGRHTYEIVYQARGALATYPDLTELYWNVTGDGWNVPIRHSDVMVAATKEAQVGTAQFCYVGTPGSSKKCEDSQYDLAAKTAFFSASNLNPGEEFTIAQAVLLPESPVILERTVILWFWLIGLGIWFVGLGVWIYRWRFRYWARRSIIPQYEPYQDFKPMFTGVLFDNRLDSRDITAGIIYLAEQGYIKIKQTTKKVVWLFETTDYELTLVRSDIGNPSVSFDDELLELLFDSQLAPGSQVTLSEIRKNVSKQTANRTLIEKIRKGVERKLVDKKLLEQRMTRTWRNVLLVLIGFGGWTLFIVSGVFGGELMLFVVVAGLSGMTFLLFAVERRTKMGYEALWHLKGFKDYLSVTEKERYKFHNAPAKSPEQFMQHLPYAIAFGVEEEWAKAFKDITIDAPGWYESDVPGVSFSAAAFTSDINSFATSLSSSATSASSSGSGGGGSSGGGSGGGGGGSW